jgi:hypothetical protein
MSESPIITVTPRKSFKVNQLFTILNDEIKSNYKTNDEKPQSSNLMFGKTQSSNTLNNRLLQSLENSIKVHNNHVNNAPQDRSKKGKIMHAIQTFSYNPLKLVLT